MEMLDKEYSNSIYVSSDVVDTMIDSDSKIVLLKPKVKH